MNKTVIKEIKNIYSGKSVTPKAASKFPEINIQKKTKLKSSFFNGVIEKLEIQTEK